MQAARQRAQKSETARGAPSTRGDRTSRPGRAGWLRSPFAVALVALPVSLLAAIWIVRASAISLWWVVPLQGLIGAAITLVVLALAVRFRR